MNAHTNAPALLPRLPDIVAEYEAKLAAFDALTAAFSDAVSALEVGVICRWAALPRAGPMSRPEF